MISVKIEVRGIVQGVGFRPFVYKLAKDYKLTGWVNNDAQGVNILLQGKQNKIDSFLKTLNNRAPILSQIDEVIISYISIDEIFYDFKIIESVTSNNKTTIISPDMSICKDCIDDINDSSNFRFNYALTNCTNCGPRYSIIKTVPYDRKNTSMKEFILCEKCEAEYTNPEDRRYHAQPVACESCGPKISLYDMNNKLLSNGIDAIEQLAKFVNLGAIVAVKGLGGFHIICDCKNDETIKNLRLKKNRVSKPFAVMFKNIEAVKMQANLSKNDLKTIVSKEKPIVLVKKSETYNLSEFIAPKIDRVGCFLAYTPLHHLLFRYLNNEIVATSANLSDEPIIINKNEVISKLSNVVDYVLDYGREIINACDDSIVQTIEDDLLVLRNARGYAPTSIKLPYKINKKILAVGANQKNSIALAFDDNIILSPYIGDLNSLISMEFFKKTIKTFENFYDFKPDVIVCDKHEDYETTKWAKQQKCKVIQVQHHYSHVLATMAEFNLNEDVLAFVFDGTGAGDDGNIWGGEIFIANRKDFKRIKHFKYFKLLGSQVAIKEPRRVALSLLFEQFTLDEIKEFDLSFIKTFSSFELKSLYTMWKKDLNSPKTSSVGRLFDAIASFSSLLHFQSYEGETGLMLEQYYDENIKESFSYTITEDKIDIKEAIREIIQEKEIHIISSMFINMIVSIICEIVLENKTLKVVLTGGVLQNKTLLSQTIKSLNKLNVKYYYNKKIPLNDGGISLGQVYHQI